MLLVGPGGEKLCYWWAVVERSYVIGGLWWRGAMLLVGSGGEKLCYWWALAERSYVISGLWRRGATYVIGGRKSITAGLSLSKPYFAKLKIVFLD